MAKVIESKKGFNLIQCDRSETAIVFGSPGICDRCNAAPETGVYIAVLNSWYCNDCFDKWHEVAHRHQEDIKKEQSNFNYYEPLFLNIQSKKEEIKKQLTETLERVNETLEFYYSMWENSRGKSDLFVYVVNEAFAMNYENGVAKMGTYSEVSILTKEVAEQIDQVADFRDGENNPILPKGIISAETFFDENGKDLQMLIEHLEELIKGYE